MWELISRGLRSRERAKRIELEAWDVQPLGFARRNDAWHVRFSVSLSLACRYEVRDVLRSVTVQGCYQDEWLTLMDSNQDQVIEGSSVQLVPLWVEASLVGSVPPKFLPVRCTLRFLNTSEIKTPVRHIEFVTNADRLRWISELGEDKEAELLRAVRRGRPPDLDT